MSRTEDPLLHRLGVVGRRGATERHAVDDSAAHGFVAAAATDHTRHRFERRPSVPLDRRGLHLALADDDSGVARLSLARPSDDAAAFSVQALDAVDVPFVVQPGRVFLAVRDATCLLVRQRGHGRPLLFERDGAGVRVTEVVPPSRALELAVEVEGAAVADDAWLADTVSAIEHADVVVGFAAAAGTWARLHRAAPSAARFDLQAFLDGTAPPTFAERAAAHVLDGTRVVQAAAVLADDARSELAAAMATAAVDDDAWQERVLQIVRRRDQLAGARLVLSRTLDVSALDAALAKLDEVGRNAKATLPVLSVVGDDPGVQRASEVAPDAWWITLGLPLDDEG